MKVPTIMIYQHRKPPLKDHGTDIFLIGRTNPDIRKKYMKSSIKDGTKYCPNCEGVKEKRFFNKNRTKKDGLAVYCRMCSNELLRQNRSKQAIYL